MKSFAHQKKVGLVFGNDRRVSMFEKILSEKDESQLFYDYKVEKKRVIGHGFGSSKRFVPVKEKSFTRALSSLNIHSRNPSMDNLGVDSGSNKHSRAVSVANKSETKLPEIFNKLANAPTESQQIQGPSPIKKDKRSRFVETASMYLKETHA